ncbi:MAG TPA: hypothetical protein VG889_11620 [Rhizomicrobium sp.]|nr:hypothetical protein [Rhizomicrobium sp.]
MSALTRMATGLVFATALTGAGVLWSAPATADSDHTDCVGNNCVHEHCYDDGSCDRTTNFDDRHDTYRDPYSAAGYDTARKPMRYACDRDGYNCHVTRSYYYDEDGRAIYDPDASIYQ